MLEVARQEKVHIGAGCRLCWRGKARKINIEEMDERFCWRGQGKEKYHLGAG